MRIDPAPSPPWCRTSGISAAAAAAPPLDPPAEAPARQGFSVEPCTRLVVSPFHPPSGVAVLPRITAPAARTTATNGASASATCCSVTSEPPVVRTPATSSRSLIVIGTPASGPAAPVCVRPLGCRRLLQRQLAGDRHERVHPRLQALDPIQRITRHLHRRALAPAIALDQLRHAHASTPSRNRTALPHASAPSVRLARRRQHVGVERLPRWLRLARQHRIHVARLLGQQRRVDPVAEEAAEVSAERHRVSAGHGDDVGVMLGQALGRITRAHERRNRAQPHHPSPLAHTRQHVVGQVARVCEHRRGVGVRRQHRACVSLERQLASARAQVRQVERHPQLPHLVQQLEPEPGDTGSGLLGQAVGERVRPVPRQPGHPHAQPVQGADHARVPPQRLHPLERQDAGDGAVGDRLAQLDRPLHDPQPAVRAVGLAPGRVQLLDRDPQRRLRQVPVVHEGR